jgi:glycerol-3-phosphate acyltransferase PlsY
VTPISSALVSLAAYLCGSIPTGFLVARARGVDIRSVGSGNIGATNVFRILGKRLGIFVLLADAAKGALPVLLLPRLLAPPEADPTPFALLAGVAAVLGHNFTCWLRFKGGKGIATSAGVLAAWAPLPFLATLGAFGLVLAVSRYVSLASILAAATLPFAMAFLPPHDRRLVLISTVLAVLAIARHHANIRRLLNGTERQIGAPVQPPKA